MRLYLSEEVVGLKEGLNRGWAWAPGRLISGWCCVTGVGAAWAIVTWWVDWLAVSVDTSSLGSSAITCTVLVCSTRAVGFDSRIGAMWGFLDFAALPVPAALFIFLMVFREADLC